MIRKEGNIPSLPPKIEELGETYGRLPFSDLRKWTEVGDIFERAFANLPLRRLAGVKTLSLLTYEKFDPEHAIFSPYEHTRYAHSFLVGLVTGEIAKLNDLPQQNIDTGIIAGFVHDIATPAFGDVAKKIDPQALDEEKHWWQSLNKKGRDFITKDLNIPRKTLDEIIKNKGILGQVLDIADRIVYAMFDLDAIPKKLHPSAISCDKFRLSVLQKVLSDYPRIGNIYKEVTIDRENQKVFFRNPENLEIFLLLRAHLYSSFYLKPENQGRDLFATQLLIPLYSRTDSSAPLTPQKLRLMTDEDLLVVLQRYYKLEAHFPQEIYKHLVDWHPKFEEFGKDHLQGAKRFTEGLKNKKDIVAVGIRKCKGFDPATSYNVIDKNGVIMPFRNFNPEHALGIEEMAVDTKRVYVFYTNISKESGAAANLLESVFMQENN